MIFTNKHVVVAMLVAPVLAIGAWYAVGHFIGERPHAAVEGGSYLLVARSNCRYDSGECDLVNGDFKVTLTPVGDVSGPVTLELVSRLPLQAATLGLVESAAERHATSMSRQDETSTRWLATLPHIDPANSLIRLAVIAGETTFYAEVPGAFLEGAR